MEARNRKLNEWLTRIGTGQLRLPRFQRFEAWGYSQVIELLESVVNELPVGAILVLDVGDAPQFKNRPIETAPDGPDRINELLLDGQQRLTGIWRGLTDSYEDRTYYLHLSEENESGGYALKSHKRSVRADGRRAPLWADDPKQLLERELVPLRLLRPGDAAGNELRAWLREATDNDVERQLELLATLSQFRDTISGFNLPFLSLPSRTKKPEVLDVFVKMNTNTVQLSAFDIIVADIEADVGLSMHDLIDGLKGAVPALGRYGDVGDLVLRAAALFQDRAPDRPGFMNVRWPEMIENWDALIQGARLAVTFLEDEQVFDVPRIPIVTPIPALVVLWSYTRVLNPDQVGAARTLLRRYLWRSFFTERYESSAHTHVLQDVRSLKAMIEGAGADGGDPPVFAADLPTADELMEAGWPKKRDRLARAALLLSFTGGAMDLADGAEIRVDNIAQREYHHMFPKAYLAERGDGTTPDRALNCSLITWGTNRTIGAKPPVEYLKDRADAHALGDEEILYRLATHGIPTESLKAGDYAEFLRARAELLHEGVVSLSDGRPWRPA